MVQFCGVKSNSGDTRKTILSYSNKKRNNYFFFKSPVVVGQIAEFCGVVFEKKDMFAHILLKNLEKT